MTNPELLFVLGTRPEIIKLAPVIHACERREVPHTVVHTGQHYSASLSADFFPLLDLSPPDYNLQVGSGDHGEQTGAMLQHLDPIIDREAPDVVVVQGDTNSTLAGGLSASKFDVALAHVEAGLRSNDRSMPEEINRTLVDRAATHLFAPTQTSAQNLYEDGIDETSVYVTGNTVVDAIKRYRQQAAEESDVLDSLAVTPDEYLLLTAHRPKNVDDPSRFSALLDGVARFARRVDTEVVYPIHPRAYERIAEHDLTVPESIRIVEPLEFLDFLRLEEAAALVFTDSGGVQEETCTLGTPCVTLRETTERPESVSVGANVLVGSDPERMVAGAERMWHLDGDWPNPYGDGEAAGHILDVVEVEQQNGELGVFAT